MTARQQSFWLRAIIGIFLLMMAISLIGCKSEVKGGSKSSSASTEKIIGAQTRSDVGNYSVEIRSDGTAVVLMHRDQYAATQPTTQRSSEASASTQPSASSNGQSLPRIAVDDDGSWAASFDQIKVPPRANWPLFLIFLAAAVALWQFTGQRLLAGGCLVLGLLAVAWPAALGWLLLASFAFVVLAFRKAIKQLVDGATNALDQTDNLQREKLKLAMAAKQDDATQRVVKGLK